MIKIEGNLVIRTINGRYGPFNVGNLSTEIGDFVVKDAALDQYDEGKYTGVFGVTRIAPSYYAQGNRIVVEQRMKIESMALEAIDALDDVAAPIAEPDPIDETPVPAPAAAPPTAEAEGADAVVSEAELFGDLWPLEGAVKLDPTVDRRVFRQQRDWLKANGYRFEAVGQTWHRQEAA